jgi:hypothetical protein
MQTTSEIRAAIESRPAGTSGLVIEPWAPGEVYGVAADWAQAAAPVYFYGHGPGGWEPRQYQVADFRHRPTEALESALREALIASGGDEDDAEGMAADATEF